jgi:hypothetical protein
VKFYFDMHKIDLPADPCKSVVLNSTLGQNSSQRDRMAEITHETIKGMMSLSFCAVLRNFLVPCPRRLLLFGPHVPLELGKVG